MKITRGGNARRQRKADKMHKSFEIKGMGDDGSGTARIAILSEVDHDGDTYAKGAFGDQDVLVLSGHSWDGPPIGKGRVFEKGGEALAEFQLNLDTIAGADWHKSMKFDVANGKSLQEWSYGFNILDSSSETRDGKSVRVLKSLDVFEVSPVVLGAGVGTGTIAIKSRSQFLTDANDLLEFAERLAVERKAEGKEFRAAWAVQIKSVAERLHELVNGLDHQDTNLAATDQDAAARLLAEFTRIQYGRNGEK